MEKLPDEIPATTQEELKLLWEKINEIVECLTIIEEWINNKKDQLL